MKHTTALVAAIGLATTVAGANTATNNRHDTVNRRSVPVMKRDTAQQQDNKRVEPRSPLRYAFPGPRDDNNNNNNNNNNNGGSGNTLKDQATDAAWDMGTSYVEENTGIRLPDRNSGSSGGGSGFPFPDKRKRSVIEPRGGWSSGGGRSNRGGGLTDVLKDAAVDEGTRRFEEETGIDVPGRNGQSSSGSSSGGGWSSWRPWKNRKREITVDEVVEEVLDKINEEDGPKADDDTADALKEIVEDAAKKDDDESVSDVVEALTEASEDGDSKSKEDSTDTMEEILDAVSSDDADKKDDKDEETLAEKIEDLVDGDSSNSKSSHGDTLEEKLEELEKKTSKLDKDDPKAEMIDELIDELIDEAATLDEIPVEYFQYWMAVQSCLDPVHLLTTKGLMASHLSRRGTTPIIVTPTKTVERREEQPAVVMRGLAQPFGAEMAPTSSAGDGLLGRGTVGYLLVGAAVAMLAAGVAF
ncbi:hypothetical protein B0T21DRAFT_385863 [Apiosordaria backusii]|uniref:Uncharacterized protein n=1 Tax=Apiosordaria backusii TaxID=314023 RepID=A0AA40AX41_9PEZI|nr:hypothetical protein B0T21DRAFT_385863 [Apiosordaria backusii]